MEETRAASHPPRRPGWTGRTCLAALAAAALLPSLASAEPCVAALPVNGEFSSGFGHRGRGFHPGVDIRAPMGSEIRAAAGGTVLSAGRWYAYGIMVEIEHRDGSRARYAHLGRIAREVAPGAAVLPGQLLGVVGRTGRTTGPHLHLELRVDGRPVNPWPWLTRTACRPGTELAEAPR